MHRVIRELIQCQLRRIALFSRGFREIKGNFNLGRGGLSGLAVRGFELVCRRIIRLGSILRFSSL